MPDDLSIGEQRRRAGVTSKGRVVGRGRPAGQDEIRVVDPKLGIDERIAVVGDEERVDLDPGDIERRRELFEEQRRALYGALIARRRAMTLHDRLREFAESTTALQAPRARAISSTPAGDGGGVRALPPGGRDMELAHAPREEIERMLRTIERAVERLEGWLDAHLGRAPARDYALMSTHEKNAIVLTEFVGWRPQEVEAFEPLLGTARTIRWVRETWAADKKNKWPGGGVRGVCGHGEGKCTDQCPKLRGPQARRAA